MQQQNKERETMLMIKELIKSRGLKATPQRIAIYGSMKKLGHACADMVVEDLLRISMGVWIGMLLPVQLLRVLRKLRAEGFSTL